MKFIISALFIYLFLSKTNAQSYIYPYLHTTSYKIPTAVPFLLINPDAKSMSLGGSGVAGSPDVNSCYTNTAKYSFSEYRNGLSLSYTPWLRAWIPDMHLLSLSFFSKIGKEQTIGGSIRHFRWNEIYLFNGGGTIGVLDPREYAADLAYTRKLSGNFSGGIALRYIQTNGASFVVNRIQAFAVDFSFYYKKQTTIVAKQSEFSMGAVASNIGSKYRYQDDSASFLPASLKFGMGLKIQLNPYDFLEIKADADKLLVPTPPVYYGPGIIPMGKDPNRSVLNALVSSFSDAPGGIKEECKEIYYSGGAEYGWRNILFLRSGFSYQHIDKGWGWVFHTGLGVKYKSVQVDASYLIPEDRSSRLENTMQFSLSAMIL